MTIRQHNPAGAQDTVTIRVRDLVLEVLIGVLPHEKTGKKQKICVNLVLFLDAGPYLQDAAQGRYLDYGALYQALKSWESRPHVELIETLLEELAALGLQDQRVRAVEAAIRKMDVFSDSAGAELTLFRSRP